MPSQFAEGLDPEGPFGFIMLDLHMSKTLSCIHMQTIKYKTY